MGSIISNFSHGGDVKAFADALGCNENDVIDLSSNINFVKPKLNINLNKIDISKYQNYDNFYEKLSKFYKVRKSQVEFFNGGSSAIFSFIRNIKSKDIYIYSPAYLEYKKACKIYGKNIILINRFYKDTTKDKIKKGSTIIFVNPSTPDGKYYDLKEKLKYWQKKECEVLIDESFIDFTDNKSIIKYIKKYDNLYILKSMTKFYSCASVRFGVIISNKQNIKDIKKKEPLWKISIYDRTFIENIIKDKKFKEESLYKNKKAKKYLQNIIEKSNHFDTYLESDANFFLVKLKKLNAKQFNNKLAKYKIMTRDCSNFDFLNKSHIRIAVKSKNDLKVFENALKDMEK